MYLIRKTLNLRALVKDFIEERDITSQRKIMVP